MSCIDCEEDFDGTWPVDLPAGDGEAMFLGEPECETRTTSASLCKIINGPFALPPPATLDEAFSHLQHLSSAAASQLHDMGAPDDARAFHSTVSDLISSIKEGAQTIDDKLSEAESLIQRLYDDTKSAALEVDDLRRANDVLRRENKMLSRENDSIAQQLNAFSGRDAVLMPPVNPAAESAVQSLITGSQEPQASGSFRVVRAPQKGKQPRRL